MSTDSTPTEVFENVDPDPDAVLAEFDVESPEDVADAGGAHDPIPDDHVDADDTTAAELFADLAAQAREAETLEEQEFEEQESDESATAAADDSSADESPPAFEEFEAAFVGEPAVTTREDEGLVESTAAELNAVAERVFSSDGRAPIDEAGEASDADEAGEPVDADVSIETVDADEVEDGTPTDGRDGAAETDARGDTRSDDGSGSERTLTLSDGADGLTLVGPDPTPTRVDNNAFSRTGTDAD